MTFPDKCVKIISLNRGADEHQYSLRGKFGQTAKTRNGQGKGISAEAQTVHTALGIRENTRMTVTVREELFT